MYVIHCSGSYKMLQHMYSCVFANTFEILCHALRSVQRGHSMTSDSVKVMAIPPAMCLWERMLIDKHVCLLASSSKQFFILQSNGMKN